MCKKRIIPFIGVCFAISIMILFPPLSHTQQRFTIQNVDDVEIVSNPKEPIPEDGMRKKIVFEEDLSIGVVEGDENYMFGGMICFNTDGEGNFYVSDKDALRIQKYSPEGEYLLSIGRKGQGPGEFQSLSVARFDKDENLYICDVTGRKISFFSKEGKFLKQIALPGSYENVYINSKGLIIADKYEQSFAENALNIFSTFGLFDQKFTLLAELHKIKREIALPGKDLSARIQIMANMINLAVFKPQDFLTLARNDFIYFGHPEKYEINIFSPGGKLVKKITRDYEPVPVNQKDREYVEEELSQQENIVDAPEDFRKKLFQRIEYPKYKPAYQGFTIVGSGLNQSFTLMENGWLVLIADYVKGEYAICDLFDHEGKYIGNFKTSVPVEGLFFYNDKAYAVATAEGYKFVKRYRIEIQDY